MKCNHTIQPETVNILGHTSTTHAPNHIPDAQEEPPRKQSLWERVKYIVKKGLGYIRPAVVFTKENIVPIATAVAALLNAWTNYCRCTGKARDSVCYA